MMPEWSTACLDWEDRIVAGESLIPFPPLFPDEANAALDLFRDLRIVDAPGSPMMSEACRPWLFDFVSTIFGAYDASTGRQLIRYFFLLISKKNAKSTGAAGIMLTALMRNFRESGEFYILAPTKEVANNSFAPARDMIKADEALSAILHPNDGMRTITHRNTGAFLKVVAADSETVSGKKTIGLFVDELWLFGKRANAGSMIREAMGGLASRPEGFAIFASTQSDSPPAGVFAQKLQEFRDIRDGKVRDPRSLGVFYEFPKRMIESGDFKKPENFYVTNPNIDASVDREYLLDQLGQASRAGQADLNNFYAKHLNVQIGMNQRADGWAGAVVWERGIEIGLTLDAILERCEVVTIGIDGGGLDDLLGVGLIGREKGSKRWLGWAHALISDIGIERRKANIEQYDQFEREGDLTKYTFGDFGLGASTDRLTEVAAIADIAGLRPEHRFNDGITYVIALVKRVQALGLLAQVGVDAAGIGAIVDALAEISVTQDAETLDAVRQGIALMGAIKTIEIKLADFSFRHGGGAMLKWCVGNLRVVPTPTAMRVARDESGYGKVDPVMALFNAGHLMSLNPEPSLGSIFDRPELWDQPDVVAVRAGN
jgi:phage terminase large subunit-like protein